MNEQPQLYVESDHCDWHESDRCIEHPWYCVAGCLEGTDEGCVFPKVPVEPPDDMPKAKLAWIETRTLDGIEVAVRFREVTE